MTHDVSVETISLATPAGGDLATWQDRAGYLDYEPVGRTSGPSAEILNVDEVLVCCCRVIMFLAKIYDAAWQTLQGRYVVAVLGMLVLVGLWVVLAYWMTKEEK